MTRPDDMFEPERYELHETLEPERYELHDTIESARYELREITLRESPTGPSRREFLKVLGGGIVVVLVTRRLPAQSPTGPASVAPSLATAHAAEALAGPEELGAWLHIDGTGAVTVYTGKVEFGQGIRTSLAQELAEELRVPLGSVRMVMGDTELTQFDQGTFGSRSTPQMGSQLRKVGAAARELLVGLAAERFGEGRSGLVASDGRVSSTGGTRTVTYGELTAGRRLTETVRDDAELTPTSRWTVAGTPVPKVGGRDVVTGRHHYTSDLRLDGMLHGKILRATSIGASLATLDDAATKAMRDVVVLREGDFVGVAAPSVTAAEGALSALRATWTPANGPLPSSRDVFTHLKRPRPRGTNDQMEGGGGNAPFVKGDVTAAFAAAAHHLEHSYTVAYIAHVPLEPRAAVAQWTRDAGGEKLTVWTGTQRPFGVRDELSRALGVAPDRVRVIVPDTGSGYGGKHTGDAAIEAARLAKAAGKPVKLTWTREEEFRWAYFRPAGVIDVRAGADASGTITAWAFDNYNSGTAAIRPMYAIANQRVTFHPSESPLRQGSYRGLAATANQFARETMVDELAHAAKMDALAFRLKNLEDPRLKAVLEAAAERFGWGKSAGEGGARAQASGVRTRSFDHGVGLACGFEKGGYIATCSEVAVDRASGAVRIVRVVAAFDSGVVINPDGLRNQISGAMVQGIGGALFEAIEFESGVVKNAHLRDYRVPRFSDLPAIDVVLIDRKDQPPFGAGESPIMALAPAVGAAIFEATGVRPRALPMARGGAKPAATLGGR